MSTDRIERRWSSLRATILRQAPCLRRRGSLVEKTIAGRPYWYLRYQEIDEGGRRVHRAVYVGADQEVVERTRRLIEQLREKAQELAWLGAMTKTARRLFNLVDTKCRKRKTGTKRAASAFVGP